MSTTWEDYQTDGCDTSQESISLEAAKVGREFNRGLDDMVAAIDNWLVKPAAVAIVCGCLYFAWHIWRAVTR